MAGQKEILDLGPLVELVDVGKPAGSNKVFADFLRSYLCRGTIAGPEWTKLPMIPILSEKG